MPWSERQRAMLREMGVRVWTRDRPPIDPPARTGAETFAPQRGAETAAAASPAIAPLAAPREDTAAAVADAIVPADWLIVGDPVGAAEGDSSAADLRLQDQLLANMLRAIHVSRSAPARAGRACIVTSAGAQPDASAASGGAGMARRVDAVRPRVIVALGRAAAAALLAGDEPLGKLRGRVHEFRGVPVVASFALAYLLRHPSDKAKAWADLCLAVRAIESAGEVR